MLYRVFKLALLIGVGLGCLGAYWGVQYARAHLAYSEAVKAMSRDDLAATQEWASKAITLWPSYKEAYLVCAQAARRRGEFDSAARQLGLYQEHGGSRATADLEYQLIAAMRGDLASVEQGLFKLVESGHPNQVLILEALTKGFLATFQWPKAFRCLNTWLEQQPDCIQALMWRAAMYQRLARWPEAIADYQKVVDLDGKHFEARQNLAELLLLTRKPKEALQHVMMLREQDPDNDAVNLTQARCELEMNRVQEAQRILDDLIARKPARAELLRERGKLALETGQAGEAEKWLRQARKLASRDRETLQLMYRCLQQVGKHEEGKECQALLEKVEEELNQLQEITRQVMQHGTDPEPRCLAGRILIGLGQDKEGLRWIDSALRISPNYAPAHKILAEYYARVGDTQKAEHHKRRSLAVP